MSGELIPRYQGELSLEQLQAKVDKIERQLQVQSIDIEGISKRVPDTNIINPNFLKCAFTVYGHVIVAGLIIAVPIYCLVFFLTALLIPYQ
jgi:hypothetical protein